MLSAVMLLMSTLSLSVKAADADTKINLGFWTWVSESDTTQCYEMTNPSGREHPIYMVALYAVKDAENESNNGKYKIRIRTSDLDKYFPEKFATAKRAVYLKINGEEKKAIKDASASKYQDFDLFDEAYYVSPGDVIEVGFSLEGVSSECPIYIPEDASILVPNVARSAGGRMSGIKVGEDLKVTMYPCPEAFSYSLAVKNEDTNQYTNISSYTYQKGLVCMDASAAVKEYGTGNYELTVFLHDKANEKLNANTIKKMIIADAQLTITGVMEKSKAGNVKLSVPENAPYRITKASIANNADSGRPYADEEAFEVAGYYVTVWFDLALQKEDALLAVGADAITVNEKDNLTAGMSSYIKEHVSVPNRFGVQVLVVAHKCVKAKAEEVPARCTECGVKEHYYCASGCENKWFREDLSNGIVQYTEALTEELVIKPLGHDMEKTEAKTASCKEEGAKEYYACKRCEKFFEDSEGKTEIAADDLDGWKTVAKLTTHTFGTDGKAEMCSVCNAKNPDYKAPAEEKPGEEKPGTTPGGTPSEEKPGTAPGSTPGEDKPGTTPEVTPAGPAEHTAAVKSEEGQSVTTTVDGTAAVTMLKKSSKKSIKVPAFVTVDGVKYDVTEIGASAFKACKNATTVTLPGSVIRIKAKAFANSKIKTVKLSVKKGTKLSIHKNAFKGSKVKTVQVTMYKGAKKSAKNAVKKAFKAAIGKKITLKIK